MPNPTIRIHNTETNEIIDRKMTDEEFAIYEEDANQSKAKSAALEQKAAAKRAVLEKLGLTADEAALLLS
jgi:hypothetical protein